MKIALVLEPLKNSYLQYDYYYLLYSFITSLCDKKHNEKVEGKFTFLLDLLTKRDELDKTTRFQKSTIYVSEHDRPILYISSNDREFIELINQSVISRKLYNIGDFRFTISKTSMIDFVYDKECYLLNTTTLLVVRDNLGKCLTPNDKEFERFFISNINKKLDSYKKEIGVDVQYEVSLMILNDLGVVPGSIKIKHNKSLYGSKFKFMIRIKDGGNQLIYKLIESGFGYQTQMGLGMVQILKSV